MLAANGGPTETEALGAGSAAIDAIATPAACAATDQRGVVRPQGAGCDIGAYEAGPPKLDVDKSALAFGTQPLQTLSATQTVTLDNDGGTQLSMTPTISGANPDDFLITSNTCGVPLIGPQLCVVTVRFSPQAAGARSATLTIADYPGNALAAVALTGSGGALPTGPTGATGPSGPKGATGPQGPAGQIELVVCTTKTKTHYTGHGRHRKKHTTKQQQCSTKLVSGTVKFTIDGDTSASISRADVVYASGSAVKTRGGRVTLRLHARRAIPGGRYTLTLRTRRGGVQRTQITIL
jgi:hypothetical protein